MLYYTYIMLQHIVSERLISSRPLRSCRSAATGGPSRVLRGSAEGAQLTPLVSGGVPFELVHSIWLLNRISTPIPRFRGRRLSASFACPESFRAPFGKQTQQPFSRPGKYQIASPRRLLAERF